MGQHASEGSFEMIPQLVEARLIARGRDGRFVLTKTGNQALLRRACVLELRQLLTTDTRAIPDTTARAWLITQKFVEPARTLDEQFSITRRGIDWLATLTGDYG